MEGTAETRMVDDRAVTGTATVVANRAITLVFLSRLLYISQSLLLEKMKPLKPPKRRRRTISSSYWMPREDEHLVLLRDAVLTRLQKLAEAKEKNTISRSMEEES